MLVCEDTQLEWVGLPCRHARPPVNQESMAATAPLFTSLSHVCRRLRELKAVNCGSLNLAASELHCPALQEANFFGCRQLDAEGERE